MMDRSVYKPLPKRINKANHSVAEDISVTPSNSIQPQDLKQGGRKMKGRIIENSEDNTWSSDPDSSPLSNRDLVVPSQDANPTPLSPNPQGGELSNIFEGSSENNSNETGANHAGVEVSDEETNGVTESEGPLAGPGVQDYHNQNGEQSTTYPLDGLDGDNGSNEPYGMRPRFEYPTVSSFDVESSTSTDNKDAFGHTFNADALSDVRADNIDPSLKLEGGLTDAENENIDPRLSELGKSSPYSSGSYFNQQSGFTFVFGSNAEVKSPEVALNSSFPSKVMDGAAAPNCPPTWTLTDYSSGAWAYEPCQGSASHQSTTNNQFAREDEEMEGVWSSAPLNSYVAKEGMTHEVNESMSTAKLASPFTNEDLSPHEHLLAQADDSKSKILDKNQRIAQDLEAVKKKLRSQRTENEILKRKLERYEQSTSVDQVTTPISAPGKKNRRKRSKKSPQALSLFSPSDTGCVEACMVDVDAEGSIVETNNSCSYTDIPGRSQAEDKKIRGMSMKVTSLESQQEEMMHYIHKAMKTIEQRVLIQNPKDFIDWSIAEIQKLKQDKFDTSKCIQELREEISDRNRTIAKKEETHSKNIEDLNGREAQFQEVLKKAMGLETGLKLENKQLQQLKEQLEKREAQVNGREADSASNQRIIREMEENIDSLKKALSQENEKATKLEKGLTTCRLTNASNQSIINLAEADKLKYIELKKEVAQVLQDLEIKNTKLVAIETKLEKKIQENLSQERTHKKAINELKTSLKSKEEETKATMKSQEEELRKKEGLIAELRTTEECLKAQLESKNTAQESSRVQDYQQQIRTLEVKLKSTEDSLSRQKEQAGKEESSRETISAKDALIRGLQDSIEVQKDSIILLKSELKKKNERKEPAHRPVLRRLSVDSHEDDNSFDSHNRAMHKRTAEIFKRHEEESARFENLLRVKIELRKAEDKASKERSVAATSSRSVQCNAEELPSHDSIYKVQPKPYREWLQTFAYMLLILMFFGFICFINYFASFDQQPFGGDETGRLSAIYSALLFYFDGLGGRNGPGGWVMPG